MYIVRKYKVAMVRQRLSQALDQAERGEPVFIERAGVTYRLSVEPPAGRAKSRPPLIESLDPAVEGGDWTWAWTRGALRFRSRPAR
jgi:hypothetical protein